MQHNHLDQEVSDNLSCADRRILAHYASYLAERGCGCRTQQGYVGVVAHWLRWRLTLSEPLCLDWHSVKQFLDQHLPVCQCANSGDKLRKTARAALNQLLVMHGYERIRSTYSGPTSSAIDAWIVPFDGYLKTLRGLTRVTRQKHCQCIRHFLWWYCGEQAVDVAAIRHDDLTCPSSTLRGLCWGRDNSLTQSHIEEGRS